MNGRTDRPPADRAGGSGIWLKRLARLAAACSICGLLSACWAFDNPVDPLNGGQRAGITSSGSTGGGGSGGATFDTTPPTVAGGVASSMAGPDTVDLSWSAASDNSTTQSELQYEVVDSTSAISTVAQAEASSVALAWASNFTSASVPVSSWNTAAGSFHYFAVLVRDLAGNVAMYPVVKRKGELYDIVALVGNSTGTATAGTHVFLNDGNGNLSFPTGTQGGVLSVASSGYSGLALANLTSHAAPADGGPAIDDIFVTNNNVSPNEVWKNNGNSTFTQVAQSWSTAPSTAVALGPISGVSGETDAYVANNGAVSTVWLDSSGTGVFSSTTQINLVSRATTSVAMGSLTPGGSAADVFTGNSGQTNLVWENLSGSYLAYGESYVTASDYTNGVAAADLNGDGISDVFVANGGASGAGGQNYVYLNGSGGSALGSPTAVGPATSDSTAVALGDLNGDGTIDAFVVNSGSPDTVWSNNGAGGFTQVNEPAFSGMTDAGTAVALGDLNGDGILDAVVASGGANGTIKVWLGNGDGTFTEVPEPNIPSGDYVAVAIGRLR